MSIPRIHGAPGTSTRPDWRTNSACRHEDPELFFPLGTSDRYTQQVAEAKAVCARCPVLERCLEWVLNRPEEAGVWAGLDEAERRRIHARRHQLIRQEKAA